ncbi:methyltransferase family protein [Nocardiopsis quinghaiensis]|uniref:methyltransferase family protein n=1 Tax=Nocardiopsis quinghaiensis TaxID=464995 RepID=UPI001CC22517|nr:isoprenylcysteine carboxylmethyltransferase family protein [Nocardiopsis quinghaiensis]
MATAALSLYLLGLLLAFGLRSLLSWLRTGDTGFRRPGTDRLTPAWWGAVLFVVAVLLGPVAPAAVLAGAPFAPLAAPVPVGWGGIVLMVVGLVLVLASQAAMGASWRVGVDPDERTGLVTGGVFALVRNPVFTAMGLLLAGLVAAVPAVPSAAALAVFAVAVQTQVRAVEEPHLLRTHGRVYEDYAARTGRFLPGLGRLPDPGTVWGTAVTAPPAPSVGTWHDCSSFTTRSRPPPRSCWARCSTAPVPTTSRGWRCGPRPRCRPRPATCSAPTP